MSRFSRVILITVDCLRADHVGCIGGGGSTPNIDKLAKNSMVFTRTFANGPATSQSFPAILSSTYFLMHKGLRLSPLFTTLAEVLIEKGFRTVAFHSNPFLSGKLGWNRGFMEFFDFLHCVKLPSASLVRGDWAAKMFRTLVQRMGLDRSEKFLNLLRRKYYELYDFQMPYVEGRLLNKHVFNWVRENKKKSFFVWMHYMDPHEPFIPPDEYLGLTKFRNRKEAYVFNIAAGENPSTEQMEPLKKLYELEVNYVDACVGQLVEFLKAEEILESSLLLLIADHGQEFKEHGNFGHLPHSLYNEVLHVPFIIYGLNGMVNIDYPVQLLDIAPTILEALNLRIPKAFMGRNLLPLVRRGKGFSTHIFSESAKSDLNHLRYDLSKKAVACLYNGWKLIINDITNTMELYNLEKDRKETTNLIEEERDIANELKSLIKRHLRKEYLLCSKIRFEERIKERPNTLGYFSN